MDCSNVQIKDVRYVDYTYKNVVNLSPQTELNGK